MKIDEEELDEILEEYLDKHDDYLDNQIQKNHEKTIELLFILLMACCFCFGIYVFILFLHIEFHNDSYFWVNFKNRCCSFFYNETRCELNDNCKTYLENWINSQNINRRILEDCCYRFAPYLQWKTNVYCNPYCLK